jgi:hypothetical protein
MPLAAKTEDYPPRPQPFAANGTATILMVAVLAEHFSQSISAQDVPPQGMMHFLLYRIVYPKLRFSVREPLAMARRIPSPVDESPAPKSLYSATAFTYGTVLR